MAAEQAAAALAAASLGDSSSTAFMGAQPLPASTSTPAAAAASARSTSGAACQSSTPQWVTYDKKVPPGQQRFPRLIQAYMTMQLKRARAR